jgi:predicted acyltransferase
MDTTKQRLVSLDAFRGATIAGMILVNNPGTWSDIYPQLRHAVWNGWTFTDFIFPFFLWIVGVSMTLSFARRVEEGADKPKLLLHVLRRAAIIFGLGLFLNGFPFGLVPTHDFTWAHIRIPGVLQRIAVCYLIASTIFLYSGIRGQIAWIAGLLVSYWLVIKLVPVPGFGPGVLDMNGNLCWFIDSNLLAGHTWRGSPVAGFDPEGILSTIPAIGTALMGVLTGHLLRSKLTREEKTAWMFVAGNFLLLLGAILDMWLPINKGLWTSSYVIFMAGWANVCLAMFYWLIDVKGYKAWSTPFVIYGMNAITVFVLSGLIAKSMGLVRWVAEDGQKMSLWSYIYQTVYVPLASPMNSSLLFAISFISMMFLVVWFMWKKRWFLKV